jgi:hypothetical protein
LVWVFIRRVSKGSGQQQHPPVSFTTLLRSIATALCVR